MPPTGFHGLLGLLLASKLDPKHDYIRVGLVTGSVVPDLDLLGSVLIYILTNDTDLTIAFHRSVTHSLVVIFLILLIGFLIKFSSEPARIMYFPFIIGLTVGMGLHVALDMFYFDGVTLFWPFQAFGDRTRINPFTFEDLSPAYNSLAAKIIGTLDGHFELIYYLLFVYLANKYHTNQKMKIGTERRNIIINNWTRKLELFSYFLIFSMVFFLCFAFLSIAWPIIDRNTFIILLYIPLTPVYLLSGILPLVMRETIVSLGKKSNY